MSSANVFAALPPELYTAILDQVPTVDLQHTTSALARALPRSPVPLYHLFLHVRLTRAEQVNLLGKHLRANPEDALRIRKFSLDMWTVDADVALNLVHTLPRLTWLSLCIGTNFSPEHLEEFFEKPMVGLRFLSLRFRPYVKQATYYQFLKGAYFDSTLLALSKWPATDLPSLSITQDPLDPKLAPAVHFAQPLVFFRLEPLSKLACSPFLENLTNFRIRIPSRQISRFVYSSPAALPSIDFLDLSTCSVNEQDIKYIMQRFLRLQHLVLDHSSIWRGDRDGAEWAVFGRTLVTAGVQRAKEREKKLKEWIQMNLAQAHVASEGGPAVQVQGSAPAPRRPRRGRRGLATAAISLRASPPRADRPLPHAGGSRGAPDSIPKLRIVPVLPPIRTLCLTPSPHIQPSAHASIRAEFERGWNEGLSTLTAVRRRLRQSSTKGTRTVRFATIDDDEFVLTEDGYDGLVDVRSDDNAFKDLGRDRDEGRCPTLCLAGPGEREGYEHVEACGHTVAEEIWEDNL